MVALPYGYMGFDPYASVKMKANGAIALGEMVVRGTDGVAPAADDCTTGIFGIALNAAVDDAEVIIATQGVFKMDLATGFAPAINDPVFVATSLTVDVGDAADFSVGWVCWPTPTSGITANVLLVAKQAITSIVFA